MIIQPPESVARRWAGALQARLRRAPLENFLLANALKITFSSSIKDTDNIARAVIFIVNHGIATYCRYHGPSLSDVQQEVVARNACAASFGIARLIQAEPAWRVAALLSTAQLLSPYVGMNAAATRSTFSVRAFHVDMSNSQHAVDIVTLSEQAMTIVRRNQPHYVETASWSLVRRLEARRASLLLPAAQDDAITA
jgi:hypothetical protein